MKFIHTKMISMFQLGIFIVTTTVCFLWFTNYPSFLTFTAPRSLVLFFFQCIARVFLQYKILILEPSSAVLGDGMGKAPSGLEPSTYYSEVNNSIPGVIHSPVASNSILNGDTFNTKHICLHLQSILHVNEATWKQLNVLSNQTMFCRNKEYLWWPWSGALIHSVVNSFGYLGGTQHNLVAIPVWLAATHNGTGRRVLF